MTINNLQAILTKLIANGHGRKTVCVDKSKISHVLEDDGSVIIPITAATIKTHEMIGDDGGLKELASGRVATRTALTLEAELGSPSKDSRLRCVVAGDRLVVSIGIDTLAFAAEHQDDNPRLKVLDSKRLADDVYLELLKESEIGETMLTKLFDQAVTAACENGSTAFDHDQPVPER